MSGGETFYDLLGVDGDASQEAIERAYRTRVKQYHPDVSDDPDARQRFKRINRARDVLCDRRERARYDRLGHETYLAREQSGTTNRGDRGTAGPAGTAGTGAGGGGTDAGPGRRGSDRSGSDSPGESGSARGAGRTGGSKRAGTGGSERARTRESRHASDGSSGRSRSSTGGAKSRGTGAADAGSAGGGTAGATGTGTDGTGGSARDDGSTVRGRGATAEAGPGGPHASRAPRGDPGPEVVEESTGEDPRTPGRFALGEAVAGLGLAGVAAGSIGLAVAVGGDVPVVSGGVAILVASWLVVAAVAGALAARSAGWLPDEVVRAQAFPLALFVGAWYVRLGTDYGAVALVLVAYAAHATLFRTAALVAGGERSTVRSAAVWFVGSAPAAVLVYATRITPGGSDLVGGPVVGVAASASDVLGGALVLAVAVPVAVGVMHAGWRFLRLLG